MPAKKKGKADFRKLSTAEQDAILNRWQKRLDDLGIEVELEPDRENWLKLSEAEFENCFVKPMMRMRLAAATATAAREPTMKVPPIFNNGHDDLDAKNVVREGLNERKNRQN